MAAQKQTKSRKKDPLLDHLDEIDDELDAMEADNERKQARQRKEQGKKLSRTLILVVAAALAGMLGHAMIFSSDDDDEPFHMDRIIDTTGRDKEQETISDEQAKKVYDTLRSGTITLDGDTYDLEMTLQDFIDNGWQYASDDGSDEIGPDKRIGATLIRNGKKIDSVYLENYGDEQIPLSRASVASIQVNSSGIDAEVPLGLKIGMDENETEQCFKDADLPYEIKNYDYATQITSYTSYHSSSPDYSYGSINVYASVSKDTGTLDYFSFSLYGSDTEYSSITISQ